MFISWSKKSFGVQSEFDNTNEAMISKQTVFTLLVGVLAIKFSDGLSFEQESEIDSLVRDVFMAESDIPGAAVTIVENFGESVFSRGYGYSDIDRNISADANTKFCIASITKVKSSPFQSLHHQEYI